MTTIGLYLFLNPCRKCESLTDCLKEPEYAVLCLASKAEVWAVAKILNAEIITDPKEWMEKVGEPAVNLDTGEVLDRPSDKIFVAFADGKRVHVTMPQWLTEMILLDELWPIRYVALLRKEELMERDPKDWDDILGRELDSILKGRETLVGYVYINSCTECSKFRKCFSESSREWRDHLKVKILVWILAVASKLFNITSDWTLFRSLTLVLARNVQMGWLENKYSIGNVTKDGIFILRFGRDCFVGHLLFNTLDRKIWSKARALAEDILKTLEEDGRILELMETEPENWGKIIGDVFEFLK